jgi:hypothetical protein
MNRHFIGRASYYLRRAKLGDVVAVAAGEGDHQREAAGGDDQVVLGAGPAAVDRRWPTWSPYLWRDPCQPVG